MGSDAHPLLTVLEDAAAGRFPPADGAITILPYEPEAAVVAFTMRHYVLTNVAEHEVRDNLDPGNFASPMLPDFLGWLGQRQGLDAGYSDLVLASPASGGSSDLVPIPSDSVADHPRVARALQRRAGVEVLKTPERDHFAIFGRGLAGRLELSIEIEPDRRGQGHSRQLIEHAVRTRSVGQTVFAQVSPGNVASLRAFLAAGFLPVCAEVIFDIPEGATVNI